MPKAKRERRERTDNYHLIQQWCRTPEQRLYEGIRPVVLYGLPPVERAQETGLPARSLGRAADAFDTHGMISLFRPTKAQQEDHHRSLPVAMRQLIVDLKAEYADFTDGEIAAICAIQFSGRRPSHHTVKAVLADGPPPSRTGRQFPPYQEIADPQARRHAVIHLHAQGWSISTIARYLDVSRPTIYAILKRWVEEGVRGLPDKSHANTSKRGVDLPTRNLIRKKQEENPLLGEWRMYAALKQLGISISPRTCGRIMAENRRLYAIKPPPQEPHQPKVHPFKAASRHEYWSCDIRYIEEHLLPDPKPVYVITVFENFSRAVLASAISATQTQWDYLAVLADAIRRFGAPEALVTEGGGQFSSTVAMQLYDMLGIRKERIDAGAPWENYAETLFSIQKRLADHAFSNARTWPEIQQAHQTWWHNYNVEHHYAHRERQDGRHSPSLVLRGMLGRTIPGEVLSRALYATQFTRHLDKYGYVRFKNWRFYGENGLAGEEVSVWVYEGTLKIEYQATALSLYSVRLSPDQQITEVKNPRRIETHFRSPQLDLWRLSDTEWLLALRRPEPGPRKQASKIVPLARQLPLPIFGATG
jgi:putative transposase